MVILSIMLPPTAVRRIIFLIMALPTGLRIIWATIFYGFFTKRKGMWTHASGIMFTARSMMQQTIQIQELQTRPRFNLPLLVFIGLTRLIFRRRLTLQILAIPLLHIVLSGRVTGEETMATMKG